jgi:hypothetical protein
MQPSSIPDRPRLPTNTRLKLSLILDHGLPLMDNIQIVHFEAGLVQVDGLRIGEGQFYDQAGEGTRGGHQPYVPLVTELQAVRQACLHLFYEPEILVFFGWHELVALVGRVVLVDGRVLTVPEGQVLPV